MQTVATAFQRSLKEIRREGREQGIRHDMSTALSIMTCAVYINELNRRGGVAAYAVPAGA